MPARFPFGTVTACRAFYVLAETDPAGAVRLAKALYAPPSARGATSARSRRWAAIADRAGFDGEALSAGIRSQRVKDLLKGEVDEAVRRKVFGSPFFFADGEPFWGNDRLEEVESWFAAGGW